MIQTTISDYQIRKFADIVFIDNNVRFKVVLQNGMKVPADKQMTLNINQIDDDAKERLKKFLEGSR